MVMMMMVLVAVATAAAVAVAAAVVETTIGVAGFLVLEDATVRVIVLQNATKNRFPVRKWFAIFNTTRMHKKHGIIKR
jgi:hypothetical protein